MIAHVPVKGYFEVNCYFWIDDETKHGFLIDPGAQGHELMRLCRKNGWIIEKILLTHGHFDHIGGIAAIREEADIPVYIHEAGEVYLTDTHLNLSRYCHCDMTVHGADHFRDGDVYISVIPSAVFFKRIKSGMLFGISSGMPSGNSMALNR